MQCPYCGKSTSAVYRCPSCGDEGCTNSSCKGNNNKAGSRGEATTCRNCKKSKYKKK